MFLCSGLTLIYSSFFLEYEGREGLELHGAAEERMLISSIQKGRQLVDKLGGKEISLQSNKFT